MTDHHITIGGLPVTEGRLSIPKKGNWFADFRLMSDPKATVKGPLRIGNATWQGTVTGAAFGEQWGGMIIGGNANWSKRLPRKGYHNDAGIKPQTVISDLAREAGEKLGVVTPNASLGANFARLEDTAVATLERVAGSTPWYVDRAGVTQVGARAASVLSSVDVLSFNADQRRVEFVADDLTLVDVGTTLKDAKLPYDFVISALDVYFSSEKITCVAWAETTKDPITDSLESIIKQVLAQQLIGLYRYRVIQMVGTRVSVQSVRASAGVPDLLLIDQWPGVAGVHAELTPGGEVLVEFVQGEPVITHFVGNYQAIPTRLDIGGPGGAAAVRQGDAVEVLLPPMIFSGTIGGVPASGVLTSPLVKTLGTNTAGSGKVKVAT